MIVCVGGLRCGSTRRARAALAVCRQHDAHRQYTGHAGHSLLTGFAQWLGRWPTLRRYLDGEGDVTAARREPLDKAGFDHAAPGHRIANAFQDFDDFGLGWGGHWLTHMVSIFAKG
jgi:hypothetical protein